MVSVNVESLFIAASIQGCAVRCVIHLDIKKGNWHFTLSCCCLATVIALWLFLTVPWVGLHCGIVVFPDHTHFYINIVVYLKRLNISLLNILTSYKFHYSSI